MDKKSLSERIWSKIHVAGPDECWIWVGRRDPNGYGDLLVRIGPRRLSQYQHVSAHRFVYEERVGAVPKGLLLRHSCNTPLCCNPGHLSTGTEQDNSDDMVKSGRSLVGARNHKAKLSEEDISEIRSLRKKGLLLKDIAARFEVRLATIGYICQGKTWSSVEQR